MVWLGRMEDFCEVRAEDMVKRPALFCEWSNCRYPCSRWCQYRRCEVDQAGEALAGRTGAETTPALPSSSNWHRSLARSLLYLWRHLLPHHDLVAWQPAATPQTLR